MLSFKIGNDDPAGNSFDKYYMILVEIKVFNTLIDNKPFFDQPVKNKQEAYGKPIEMLRNDGYRTRKLLDYFYHQKYYELISIDLSRQTNTIIPRQINLPGTLGEDDDAAMSFIAEKQRKTILKFSLDSLIVTD